MVAGESSGDSTFMDMVRQNGRKVRLRAYARARDAASESERLLTLHVLPGVATPGYGWGDWGAGGSRRGQRLAFSVGLVR
jgi:hypothetical protein